MFLILAKPPLTDRNIPPRWGGEGSHRSPYYKHSTPLGLGQKGTVINTANTPLPFFMLQSTRDWSLLTEFQALRATLIISWCS
jgi:hypothetical protein